MPSLHTTTIITASNRKATELQKKCVEKREREREKLRVNSKIIQFS